MTDVNYIPLGPAPKDLGEEVSPTKPKVKRKTTPYPKKSVQEDLNLPSLAESLDEKDESYLFSMLEEISASVDQVKEELIGLVEMMKQQGQGQDSAKEPTEERKKDND